MIYLTPAFINSHCSQWSSHCHLQPRWPRVLFGPNREDRGSKDRRLSPGPSQCHPAAARCLLARCRGGSQCWFPSQSGQVGYRRVRLLRPVTEMHGDKIVEHETQYHIPLFSLLYPNHLSFLTSFDVFFSFNSLRFLLWLEECECYTHALCILNCYFRLEIHGAFPPPIVSNGGVPVQREVGMIRGFSGSGIFHECNT